MNENQGYIPPQMQPQQPQGGSGMAIASMVCGIVAVVLGWCFYYVSVPLAIVGLILGAISLNKKTPGRGMAIAGLVLSIISLALTILVFAVLGAAIGGLESTLEGWNY